MLLPGANFEDKNPIFGIWVYWIVEQLILKCEVATLKFEILVTPYSPCNCLFVSTRREGPSHCYLQLLGVCMLHMTVWNIWVRDTVLWKGLWWQWLMWCTKLYNYLGSRKFKTVSPLIGSFDLTLGSYLIRWSCDRNFQSADYISRQKSRTLETAPIVKL